MLQCEPKACATGRVREYMTRKNVRLLFGLAVAAAIVVGLALWMGRAKPIAVETVEAARGPVAETVTNTRAGTVKACERARMAPPSAGQIARLPVKKGDRVEPGQLLLELWNDDIRAELSVTERDAAATRARLTARRPSRRSQGVSEAQVSWPRRAAATAAATSPGPA